MAAEPGATGTRETDFQIPLVKVLEPVPVLVLE
jgi:hypothetical protein